MSTVKVVCQKVVTEEGDETCLPMEDTKNQIIRPRIDNFRIAEVEDTATPRIDIDAHKTASRIRDSGRAYFEALRPIMYFTR